MTKPLTPRRWRPREAYKDFDVATVKNRTTRRADKSNKKALWVLNSKLGRQSK